MKRPRRLWTLLLVPAFALVACEQPTATDGLDGADGTAAARGGSGAGPAAACDVTVDDDDGETIQGAVDAASAGTTICVEPGTYAEQVSIDEAVTVQGRTAPRGGNPATVDGSFSIEPGADGTTIRRLRITSSETFPGGTFPHPFGVLVKAGDVVVESNVIEGFRADLSDGAGSISLHGVQVFGAAGAGVSNVTVRDNVIRDFRSDGVPGVWPKYGGVAAVKLQADVDGATVRGNRIVDHHSAGWVFGVVLTASGSAAGTPTDVVVEENHVEGLNDGSVYDVFAATNDGRDAAPYPGSAFGIDGGGEADEATVRRNSLLAPNGVESKDQDDALVAQCNWWGDRSGPTDDGNPSGTGTWALERGSASVDYTPWLNAPAPSNACVGGEKPGNGGGPGNGNGPGA